MFWRIFLDPAFIAKRSLRHAVADLAATSSMPAGGIWVDVGCGVRPYESLIAADLYVGLEVRFGENLPAVKRHDVLFDGHRLPIGSTAADGVLCTQVLEHCARPRVLLEEIWRILKPGGCLILTAPFLWEEHGVPNDFERFTEYGIASLLERVGFTIQQLRKTTGSVEALAQMVSIYLSANIGLPVRGFGRLVIAVLCAPTQILGLTLQRVLPDNASLYLDNAILAHKPAQE